MGSRFLAPGTELICSGSVSDIVTKSESFDQGAKGWKTHLEIRCFLTCGRVEILTFFLVLRGMDSPVPWQYLWVGRCNDHEDLHNQVLSFSIGFSESGSALGTAWESF
jgi:hypothetical protein